MTYYAPHSIMRHMVKPPNGLAPLTSLDLELRRGVLVLAVLTQLRTEQYGYSLKKALADDGLDELRGLDQ